MQMDNTIVKTTAFRDNPFCKVLLEEMQDGRKHVRKIYLNNEQLNNEWDAMCFLYNEGFSVPEPYKKDENGMYLQYIDNGVFYDILIAADDTTKHELMAKFVKLLYDLHKIKPKDEPVNGFVKNELAEIKAIIEKKQIEHYWEILAKLEVLSAKISENKPCYIHRDYHVWNVLSDKNHKLYLIDMELKQGDCRFDVGWTYMLQSRSAVHDKISGDIAQAFLSEYYKLNPEAREDIEFFMQLANLRWLVNVAPENKSDKHWFPKMKAIAEQAITEFLSI